MTPTSEMVRIGVFGGTFDPIHQGHVAVAEECAGILDLQPVLLIPSAQPPHRPPPRASAEDRLAMVELAVAGHPRLRASDLEVRRGGVSYTVDTIRSLAAAHADAELTLLLGWDAAAEFRDWHQAEVIAGLVRVAVFNRTGATPPAGTNLESLGLPPGSVYVEVSSPPLSATSVREMLAQEGAGADLLAPAVASFVRERGLYREI